MDQLFDHILDGHKSSYEGIHALRDRGLVSDQEFTDLLKKNTERLIDRIKEFKIVHRLVCISFALLFGYMQISADDMEFSRRGRRSRSRRRNEAELLLE